MLAVSQQDKYRFSSLEIDNATFDFMDMVFTGGYDNPRVSCLDEYDKIIMSYTKLKPADRNVDPGNINAWAKLVEDDNKSV